MTKPRLERRKHRYGRAEKPENYMKTRFSPTVEKKYPLLYKSLVGIYKDPHLNRLEKYRHMRNALVIEMNKTKKGSPENQELEYYLKEIVGKKTRWSNSQEPLLDRRKPQAMNQ